MLEIRYISKPLFQPQKSDRFISRFIPNEMSVTAPRASSNGLFCLIDSPKTPEHSMHSDMKQTKAAHWRRCKLVNAAFGLEMLVKYFMDYQNSRIFIFCPECSSQLKCFITRAEHTQTHTQDVCCTLAFNMETAQDMKQHLKLIFFWVHMQATELLAEG